MLRKIQAFLGGPSELKKLTKILAHLEDELDFLKSKMDLSPDLFENFYKERMSALYKEVYEIKEPLVTVCIATFNRGELLIKRSINSVLNQTYKNLEIIVVGDCCTDNTEYLVLNLKDEKVKFFNLAERGRYPEDPLLRWMVAGTSPMNYALELAKGDFITHLDDDDHFSEDRIQKLVDYIQKTRADIVWHPFWRENKVGKWDLKECFEFKKGQVTTSSVLYHNWFRRIPWDLYSFRYREPGDWNRFRKFKYLGANAVRYPEPLLSHFMERSQLSK